jgi:hypothetical protein
MCFNWYINIKSVHILTVKHLYLFLTGAPGRGARWPRGQCFRRAIAEAKHHSQWSVRWVTKIYYLELLRASEGTLNRWSRLHLQLLAHTPVSRKVDVRQAAGRKIPNCRILITT